METQSNLCFFPSSFIDTCASNTVSSCLWLTSFSTVSSAQAKLSSLSGSLCLSREHDRTELFFSFKRRNKAKRTTCTYNLSSLISICEDFLFTGPWRYPQRSLAIGLLCRLSVSRITPVLSELLCYVYQSNWDKWPLIKGICLNFISILKFHCL